MKTKEIITGVLFIFAAFFIGVICGVSTESKNDWIPLSEIRQANDHLPLQGDLYYNPKTHKLIERSEWEKMK